MDADLDDLTVQFILNLSGLHTIKPYVITNDHKSETPKVVNTYNKPEDLLNAIFTEATAQSAAPRSRAASVDDYDPKPEGQITALDSDIRGSRQTAFTGLASGAGRF
jgi:hypothetical protein